MTLMKESLEEIEMDYHKRATKWVIRNDRLSQLPDDIISLVVSLLNLKEAVQTSTLSKRWRYIWMIHPDLVFDCDSILGRQSCSDVTWCFEPGLVSKRKMCKFVRLVDHVMHQRSKGLKVDLLAIHSPLDNDSASHINQWIACAVAKGVENIDLDLSAWFSSGENNVHLTASKQYKFPFQLLDAHENKCTVKQLKLASCCLYSLPTSSSIPSLVTLELQSVDVTDGQLENLLSVCLFLERLRVDACRKLVNFRCVGPSFWLKHLSVESCFRMEKMEVNSRNLCLLEYTGQLINFSFKNVPRLTEVFLSFTGSSRADGVNYTLTKIAYKLPQLKTLNLLSVRAMETIMLPEKVPSFANIKELVLTVFPFDDDDKLLWIGYILKAFPSLHRLELNLFSPSFIKQPKQIKRQIMNCPHRYLNEVEINGFYGNQHEADLVKYLVNNAAGLEMLVLSSRLKRYKGLGYCDYEAANSHFKLSLQIIEWLHQLLPPTVHLSM